MVNWKVNVEVVVEVKAKVKVKVKILWVQKYSALLLCSGSVQL